MLFLIALVSFLVLTGRAASSAGARLMGPPFAWTSLSASALFVLLAGLYLALSVSSVRLRLARACSSPVGPLLPPLMIVAAVALYCRMSGLALVPRLGIYAAYLFLPPLVGLRRARTPYPILIAAAVLWLPLEFHLLPPLPLPAVAGGYDASHLVGLVNALCLFLVTRPIGGVGFTFVLSWRDGAAAWLALVAFATVALPVGLGTRFLAWHPRVTAETMLALPWLIYLGTALPEEFLFRGIVQNTCARATGRRAALAIASVLFGLAHLPDWRYALLATFAGAAYGWVYFRTGKITASAITHTLVDWVWVMLLRV